LTRGSAVADTRRDVLSPNEILKAATALYEKS